MCQLPSSSVIVKVKRSTIGRENQNLCAVPTSAKNSKVVEFESQLSLKELSETLSC